MSDEHTIEVKVRTVEAQAKEVFMDVNDLIIDLMLEEQNCSTQEGKATIRKIIKKLTELRKAARKEAAAS